MPLGIGLGKQDLLFSNEKLAGYAKQAVEQFQEGDKVVVVAGLDNNGTHVAVVAKLDEKGRFRVAGAYKHDWTGEDIIEGGLIARF